MSSVVINQRAAAVIAGKILVSSGTSPPGKTFPTLFWSPRSYFEDINGNSAYLAPTFYFFYTDRIEIEENGYLVIEVPGVGELALGPGGFFRSGSHTIGAQDDTLVLYP
jgi:hypothetical protein